MLTFFFFFDWRIVDVLGVATSTLVIIIGNVYCWLLSNFQHIPSSFMVLFCFTFLFLLCHDASIFIFFGWCQLLFQLVCVFVFCFCSHLHLFLASCHLCLCLHLLLSTCWHGAGFCISPSLQPHHIYIVLVFTSHVHCFCFCITNVLAFLLPFLYHFFLCVNLLCFWNYLVVSLIFVFDLCKFLCFFVLVLHVSKFLGFFYLMCYVGAICLNFKLHFLF